MPFSPPGGIDPVGIKNVLGIQINPATEDTLSGIASALGSGTVTITSGEKIVAVSGVSETLVASTTSSKTIVISALETNLGKVWVGGSNVSASSKIGIPIVQGNSWAVSINDAQKIYLDVESGGDGVSYVILN